MNAYVRHALFATSITLLLWLLHTSAIFTMGWVFPSNWVLQIHLISGVMSLLVLIALQAVSNVDREKIGVTFLASVLLKLVVVAAYFVLLKSQASEPLPKVLLGHFFISYFIYLGAEAFIAMRMVKQTN